MADIVTIKGLLLPELLDQYPGLAGFKEIENWIRKSVLTPHQVLKIVNDPETGKRRIRCQTEYDHSEFKVGFDEYDRVCFCPPVEPSHFNAWAIPLSEIDDLIKIRPEIQWPSKGRARPERIVSEAEFLKLQSDFQAERTKRLELENEIAEISRSEKLTLRCDGSRADWGSSLKTLIRAAFNIVEQEERGLTRRTLEERLRASSHEPLLAEAYKIFWRLIPEKHKSGAGNPNYKK